MISRDSEHYAQLQVERIIARVERTTEMPSKGHPVHEYIELGLRKVHEGSYRIISRVHDDEMQMVTIIHMKQRLPPRRLR